MIDRHNLRPRASIFDMIFAVVITMRSKVGAKARTLPVRYSLACQVSCTLSISGSIHQGSKRLSEESRGRQCSFMSLTALLFHQYQPVQLWSSTNTVDEILSRVRDSLFQSAVRHRLIPDADYPERQTDRQPLSQHD